MVIQPVLPQTVAALKQQLTTKHQGSVTTSPDPTNSGNTEGQINGHGVVANYSYSASTQRLEINMQHHPWFIPQAHLEGTLFSMISQLQPNQRVFADNAIEGNGAAAVPAAEAKTEHA